MSDEKIIKFKDLQDKVRPSDIDKFERYMMDKFEKVAKGDISMFEFTTEISKYIEENNIDIEKFKEIEKEILKRYGYDVEGLEEEMSRLEQSDSDEIFSNFEGFEGLDVKTAARRLSFYDYYSDVLKDRKVLELNLKNDKNEVRFIFDDGKITLISEKKIDLSDEEINKIIAYYKLSTKGTLTVILCEATNKYEYH